MKVLYPVRQTASVWIGTFRSEDDFDLCVDKNVSPALGLNIDVYRICEVSFEQESMAIQDLLTGFSQSDIFFESAVSAAMARNFQTANSALVCYSVRCSDAPADWGSLKFLGSFSKQDAT